MEEKHIKVLLVENNPGDARLIQEMLKEVNSPQFEMEHVNNLSLGLKRLTETSFDVFILDLCLPDSTGIQTLERALSQDSEVPVIVLTGLADETLGVIAVQKGAQDYLIKGSVDSNLLIRSVRYAIERKRMQEQLRGLTLIDDLTGLYNRRGFIALGEQQLKIASRVKKGMLLFFIDLDGMKQINDTLGHKEGDLALIGTAEILKEVFREADIIARIGGDEFVALAIDTDDSTVEILTERINGKLYSYNAKGDHPYRLSLSMGITRYDPESTYAINELLAEADKLMYAQKRSKQK